MTELLAVPPGTSSARCRSATGCRGSSAARTSARAGAATSARRTCGASTGAGSGSPVALLDVAKGFAAALLGLVGRRRARSASSRARRRCSVTRGRLPAASRRAGRWSRPAGGAMLALAPLVGALSASRSGSSSSLLTRYASLASIVDGARAAGPRASLLGEPWPVDRVRRSPARRP